MGDQTLKGSSDPVPQPSSQGPESLFSSPWRSVVAGVGSYLPEKILTNDDLAKTLETSHAWIFERSGICQRHIAAPTQTTSDLALLAARRALDQANLHADDIDLLIVATASPDRTFPATAVRVQAELGMTRGAAFDVAAVCAGFVFALSVADNFLRTGQARTAMVIGAETFSRLVDWSDRRTCVLFGDGAGALILRAVPAVQAEGRGILSTHLFSDGRLHDLLCMTGGPSATRDLGVMTMNGAEVFRHAVNKMSEASEVALSHNALTVAEIDWVIPHQANLRIMDAVGKRLGAAPSQMIVTVDRHANTSAASIPLAMASAVEDGRLQPGHMVLCQALGGGLSWGSALLRW